MGHLGMIFLFFFSLTLAHSKVLKTPIDSPGENYNRCVYRIMNSPLTTYDRAYRSWWKSSPHLDELNQFCLCHERVDKEERNKFKSDNLSYFFSTRSGYFENIDICLQEKVKEDHWHFYYSVLAYEFIRPLVEAKLKGHVAPGTFHVKGRSPSSDESNKCMTKEVFFRCQKMQSLYFTYKCINRSFKDSKFLDDIQKSCPNDIIEISGSSSENFI